MPSAPEGGIGAGEDVGARPLPSMRGLALTGGRLGALSALVSQVLSAITTIVLARLLTPRDIGLVAAATIVIGLFEILASLGFGASLVQRPSVDRRVLSTMFWASMGLGAVVATLGMATASVTASLIGNPGVRPFIIATSLISAFGFANIVPTALLQRRLRYPRLYGTSVTAMVAYSATAVALAALTGLGPWAIVLARVAQVTLQLLGLSLGARWRPSAEFDAAALRHDLAFNAGFWGNHLTSYLAKNTDYWVVGRTAGSASLGVYYVAYVLPNIIRQRMTWVAGEVLFPLLARLKRDDDRLARAYLDSARFLAFVAYPVLLGLAAVSESIVELFFGPAWAGAVGPMRLLAAAAAIDVLTPLANVLFVSQGTPRPGLVVNGVRLAVLSAGLAAATAAAGGLAAVAAAVLASSLAAAVYGQRLIAGRFGLRMADVARAVLPMAFAGLAMVAVVRAVAEASGESLGAAAELAVLVPLGALAYLGCGLLTSRRLFRSLLADLARLAVPGRSEPRVLDGAADPPE